MRTIWKYTLDLTDIGLREIKVPKDASYQSWLVQNDQLVVYYDVPDIMTKLVYRDRFFLAFTGVAFVLPFKGEHQFLGSFQTEDGLVWHLYKEGRAR